MFTERKAKVNKLSRPNLQSFELSDSFPSLFFIPPQNHPLSSTSVPDVELSIMDKQKAIKGLEMAYSDYAITYVSVVTGYWLC